MILLIILFDYKDIQDYLTYSIFIAFIPRLISDDPYNYSISINKKIIGSKFFKYQFSFDATFKQEKLEVGNKHRKVLLEHNYDSTDATLSNFINQKPTKERVQMLLTLSKLSLSFSYLLELQNTISTMFVSRNSKTTTVSTDVTYNCIEFLKNQNLAINGEDIFREFKFNNIVFSNANNIINIDRLYNKFFPSATFNDLLNESTNGIIGMKNYPNICLGYEYVDGNSYLNYQNIKNTLDLKNTIKDLVEVFQYRGFDYIFEELENNPIMGITEYKAIEVEQTEIIEEVEGLEEVEDSLFDDLFEDVEFSEEEQEIDDLFA